MSRVAGVLLIWAISVVPAWGAVWYVDKDSTSSSPDGKSWAKAFTQIQSGINAAASAGGGEVWVAEGTYSESRTSYPHEPNQNTGSLTLRGGVALYGGFAGSETARASRDIAAHPTVIDGSSSRNGSAAYHVVVGANGATIDGFTIRGGKANGGSSSSDNRKFGGGMFNANVSPTITNCIFKNNSASMAGGAMYNFRYQNTILNCDFENNSAGTGSGGAIFQADDSPAIRECSFVDNTAKFGGALYLNNCSPTFRDCSIRSNDASGDGGGVYHTNGASPSYTACVISSNNADNGAGVYAPASGTSFTNCIFQSNKASMKGGALFVVASNSLTNCTLTSNTAATGGGIYSTNDGRPTVTNCILWDNSSQILGGQATVRYCDVEGGFTGTGNITSTPRFINLGSSSLRLRPGSPCLDKGTADNAPSTDIAGTKRPQGTGYDMGAYEGASVALTTEAKGTGSGTVVPAPGIHYYLQGNLATVKATPATGSRFDRWEGDVSGQQGQQSVTMSANKVATAIFVRQFTLTTQVEGTGSVVPAPGAYLYDSGASVTVTATAANGWVFDRWTGDATGSTNPLKFNIDENKTIKAVFVPSYTLTMGVVGTGTVTPSVGLHSYKKDETVACTATPSPGWRFLGWQGAATGTANPVSVVMNGDKTLTAQFEQIPVYTLNMQVQGEGTVIPAPGAYSYQEGETVTVSATAAADWRFDHWEGGLTGNVNPTQFPMIANRTVKAVFTLIPLTIGDPEPKLGLTIGGTAFTIGVDGWTNGCQLLVGDKPCLMVQTVPGKAATQLTAVMPPMAVGSYGVRVVKSSTGQQAESAAKFQFSDDPFRLDFAEDFDAGVEIEDGNNLITTYAVRATAPVGKAFSPIHYVSPQGVVVDVPAEAIPAGATGAFLIVRTATSLGTLLPGATTPDGIYARSAILDLHLLLPNTVSGGAPAFEYVDALPAPVKLTIPVRAATGPETYVGGLATTLDGLMAPALPDPPAMADTGAEYVLDDQNRALVDTDTLGAFTLLGPGLPGDVNGDGANDAVDVQAVVNAVLGAAPGGVDPDANGDGNINAVDVQFVVNAVLGVPVKKPSE